MSDFKGHFTGGVVASGVVGAATHDSPMMLGAVLVTMFMSLYPDIDIKSTSSKIVNAVLLAVAGWGLSIGNVAIVVVALVMMLVPLFTKHRGYSHNWGGGVAIAGILFLYYSTFSLTFNQAMYIFIGALVGFATHLLLDFKKEMKND